MKNVSFIIISCFLLYACQKTQQQLINTDPQVQDTIPSEADIVIYDSSADTAYHKDTYIKFAEFDIKLHKFYGYYIDEQNHEFITDYGADLVNDTVSGIEMLVARGDTVSLSEDLDERLNKTVLQIVPKDKDDRFKLSMAYIGNLWEYYDSIRYAGNMERYEKERVTVKEPTKFVKLIDSANFYFHATPHTADMVPVDTKDGKMILKTSTTEKEMKAEEDYYVNELDKIKKKYKLRDTLVEYPGE
jgi:hypothetical protein